MNLLLVSSESQADHHLLTERINENREHFYALSETQVEKFMDIYEDLTGEWPSGPSIIFNLPHAKARGCRCNGRRNSRNRSKSTGCTSAGRRSLLVQVITTGLFFFRLGLRKQDFKTRLSSTLPIYRTNSTQEPRDFDGDTRRGLP